MPRVGSFPLLDRAARYFPIRRLLREHTSPGDTLLEVGSGPFGIGWFRRRTFVGCDVEFELAPSPPLLPVIAQAHRLPFRDTSFDAAVLSDVLEHVDPGARADVVREALRVTRKLAVIGFPCGPEAFRADRRIYEEYRTRGLTPPRWLEEHLHNGLPDEHVLDDLPRTWRVTSRGNESVRFHEWMMRSQLSFARRVVFRAALIFLPAVVERALRRADGTPCYRRIFAVTPASP
jgi:hypothetical protein